MPEDQEFKHTHYYNPINIDRWDPKAHPGSGVIPPGSPIQRMGAVGPGKAAGPLAFIHVRDAAGNNQSVARGSLHSKKGFEVPEGREHLFPGFPGAAAAPVTSMFNDRRSEGRRDRPS